ncbi:MAG: hypothetical protein IIA45_03665, partial [Bacteroidetes bacterium]|nr:hypothetical protein [Bacteroidota bacterium]
MKDKSAEQAEPHFKYYWGKSRVPEQILLTTIAILSHASSIEKRFDLNNLKKFHQESSNIISGLEERGLVLKKDGQHRIFSPMLEEWIIREIINEKPSEKDYEEWLTDNEGYFAGTRRLYKRAKQITDHIKPKYWGMITEWLSDSENRENIVDWIVEAATTVGLV